MVRHLLAQVPVQNIVVQHIIAHVRLSSFHELDVHLLFGDIKVVLQQLAIGRLLPVELLSHFPPELCGLTDLLEGLC